MQLVLNGKIQTPIIIKKTTFYLEQCKAIIKNPRRRHFTKIVASKPMFPFSYICYLGEIELRFKCKTISRAKDKLRKLLQIQSIGRLSCEGLGKIQWIGGYVKKSSKGFNKVKYKRKLKIRKGLPHNLSEEVQQLIRYVLLHDFYHTPRHQSKIYVEPVIDDLELIEILKQHHEKTDNTVIKIIQHYDRLAARITRKIRSPVLSRYNWQANKQLKTIDFRELAQEISEVSSNIWKLYQYIFNSLELSLLNESLHHGHSSLRNHLLVMANLIVQDFKEGKV